MGSLLIDRWLRGTEPIPIYDDASCTLVRERIRDEGRRIGLDDKAIASAATAATELATNQLRHARGGAIGLRRVEDGGVPGIEIVAADRGDGIPDPAAALAGELPSVGGLGAGLSGARRLCDAMDIDVRVGEGTCIRVRKLVGLTPRTPEVGIYAIPCPGEGVCGDDAAFERADGMLSFLVADGLGHGPLAREASLAAIDSYTDDPVAPPPNVLAACDGALVGTRGAVVTSVRWNLRAAALEHAAAGNVLSLVHRRERSVRLSGPGLVLGHARASRTSLASETIDTWPRDVLATFTDGLVSRADVDPTWVFEHPIVIAQRLAQTYGRGNDDTLVLVAR